MKTDLRRTRKYHLKVKNHTRCKSLIHKTDWNVFFDGDLIDVWQDICT